MNNVSFQGHTNLIFDPKRYDNISFKISRLSKNLDPTKKGRLIRGQIYTTNVNDNKFIVIIKGDNDGFVKYIPTKGNIDNLLSQIVLKIDDLKIKSKNALTAWIIGGSKIDATNGENTSATLTKIADILCDKPQIETSILAGIKKPEEHIIIHGRKDNLDITLEKPKNTNLEDSFDIVELNNTDIT